MVIIKTKTEPERSFMSELKACNIPSKRAGSCPDIPKANPRIILRIWNKLKGYLKLIEAYACDYKRFAIYSGLTQRRSKKAATAAHLTMNFHRIEKGLSLRETRLNFGEDVVESVTRFLKQYVKRYGVDDTAASCWKCLKDYHELHDSRDALNRELYNVFATIDIGIEGKAKADSLTAVCYYQRQEILQQAKLDFASFVYSRLSVRDFSDEPVDTKLLFEAARIAQKTPSVCNRQGWRMHVYNTPESCKRAVGCQGGNRGFGELIQCAVIVTGEIEHFFSPVERNQGFIDGGLYAMTLTYALHSLGLATCCLNLSLSPKQERRLRRECGIGPNEMPIMMIAVGHYPENFKTASSQRKRVEDVISIHN